MEAVTTVNPVVVTPAVTVEAPSAKKEEKPSNIATELLRSQAYTMFKQAAKDQKDNTQIMALVTIGALGAVVAAPESTAKLVASVGLSLLGAYLTAHAATVSVERRVSHMVFDEALSKTEGTPKKDFLWALHNKTTSDMEVLNYQEMSPQEKERRYNEILQHAHESIDKILASKVTVVPAAAEAKA